MRPFYRHERAARRRKRAGQRAIIIIEVGKSALHIQNHLVRQQIPVGKNRAVIIVGFVVRIETQGRKPVTGIEIIISAANQNDDGKMLAPPIAVVPFPLTTLER